LIVSLLIVNLSEENVWKLCEWVRDNEPKLIDFCFAVFISNGSEKVPLWFQQAGDDDCQGFVIWDYHVILIYDDQVNGGDEGTKDETNSKSTCFVYDLDTLLSFPVSLEEYVTSSIQEDETLRPEFHRWFRVIPAAQYLTSFASDRSRMKREDGTWIKEPPPYPPIATINCSDNLKTLISMDPENCDIGKVMNFNQFKNRFLHSSDSKDSEKKG
ncbi:protein N-terminal glutamine amidohydrolase-like, partial [Panonychus citri]|uniref:protein N-terminal glutamine amidohydrolase-like n=1 Tax=Panonychus citri TaxID=50023 RepID=UPI0023081847